MLAVQTVRLGQQHALLGFAFSICIAACTSLSSQREQALELDDVWTANGLPCAAEKVDLPLNIRKRSGQLTATSLASKSCFAPGRTLWQAKLPAKTIVAADLPLTLAADLLLEDATAAGMLTLLSETRMILTTEQSVIEVTRGAELSGPAVGASAGTGGEPAEQGGKTGENAAGGSETAADASAGAGEPRAGAAASGNAGAAQSSAASGSGVAGNAGAPAAGTSAGMPATQAGSAAPAAGSVAPPAAGSGSAASAGGTGGATAGLPHGWKIEDLQSSYWYCVTLEGGCVCVESNTSSDEDNCFLRPRGCCYVLLSVDEINCQCHAVDSERCRSESQSPNALKVDNCPPK